MQVQWLQREVRAVCPVCGAEGAKTAILTTESALPDHPPVTFLRCAACGSAFLDDLSTPDYEHEMPEMLDYYVEQGAGIDLIVAPLVRLPPRSVKRFLEIGCSFGFALDFSRHSFGWDVLGVDPSSPAKAGAIALELPILSTYFDASLDVGAEPFDVVFCSEILEHVSDPHGLLAAIRMRLATNGLLMLSTPNAALVREDAEPGSLGRALSPGLHLILFTRESLAWTLSKAGFSEVVIEETPETLRAYAACDREALARMQPEDPARLRALMRDYCSARADSAPPASALACGLAYRHFKECVNVGMYAEAAVSRERLARIYRERFQLELDDPVDLRDREPFPFNATALHFFNGILELNHFGRPERAANSFAAAVRASDANTAHTWLGFYDGECEALANQSRKHLPMALAAFDPDRAIAELLALASAPAFPHALLVEARLQTFVRLVNACALDAADGLAPQVLQHLDLGALAAHGEQAPGALDPVYCLAMLALHRGRHAEAAEMFGFVHRAAAVHPRPERAQLLALARDHEELARKQLETEAVPS